MEMKKSNLTLKTIAVIVMAIMVAACSKDENPPVNDDEEEVDAIGTVYLENNFEDMIWGGNYLAQEPGIKGDFKRDENNKYIIDEDAPVIEAGVNTDGCPDFFAVVSDAYIALRGLSEWDGNKVFERPGYLKIGTASAKDSYISTPSLAEIKEDRVNLDVLIDLAIWGESYETFHIEVLNGGTPSVSQLQISTTREWTTKEFTVSNANKNTKISIYVDAIEGGRFFLGNIKITKAE